MGAPFAGGEVVGPAIGNIDQKVSWVEKFVAAGAPAVQVWLRVGSIKEKNTSTFMEREGAPRLAFKPSL